HFAERSLADDERTHFRQAADAIRQSIIEPTFVVADPPAVRFHRGGAPILDVTWDCPDALVSKVLAACRASREAETEPHTVVIGGIGAGVYNSLTEPCECRREGANDGESRGKGQGKARGRGSKNRRPKSARAPRIRVA